MLNYAKLKLEHVIGILSNPLTHMGEGNGY